MNGLKVFTNEDFGDVAVISIDNKPYFEGIKVARILGYKNPNDAIKIAIIRITMLAPLNDTPSNINSRAASSFSKSFVKLK